MIFKFLKPVVHRFKLDESSCRVELLDPSEEKRINVILGHVIGDEKFTLILTSGIHIEPDQKEIKTSKGYSFWQSIKIYSKNEEEKAIGELLRLVHEHGNMISKKRNFGDGYNLGNRDHWTVKELTSTTSVSAWLKKQSSPQ